MFDCEYTHPGYIKGYIKAFRRLFVIFQDIPQRLRCSFINDYL